LLARVFPTVRLAYAALATLSLHRNNSSKVSKRPKKGKINKFNKLNFIDVANYSDSSVTIRGNKQDINELYNIMVNLENMKEPAVKNGFGTTWLGCLVEALGSSWQEVSCRGEWSSLELNDGVITFNTMSAWSAPTEVFDFIKQKFPSIEIFFLSCEPGCLYFVSNDSDSCYYPDRYIVDLCTVDGEYLTEYFENLETALNWINKLTDSEVKNPSDVEFLNDKLAAENDNAFCYLHEIEII
jgi:hypothetical protein